MTHPRFVDIGACVFDAYGTLFDFNAAAARFESELDGKAARLSEIWRMKQLQYTWLRSLMDDYADFWTVTGEALDFALEAVAIEDEAIRSKLLNAYLTLDAYAEVPEMLQKLKSAGVQTAILSNGAPEMLKAAVEGAGIEKLLDATLSVEDVGIYKPHRSVYQMAVDALGVRAERISFQSANSWDAVGATHFGFRTAWCNRFGQPDEQLPAKPDVQIKSLAELPPLLGIA
ncbi:MAG: haloacid dehalogenase type II [Alphaproteobacteria bacterium]|jgi:2-haloacid dehalogenase|nr:haloacid dehalogenase type II [Alphaproteobacteria bacterium]